MKPSKTTTPEAPTLIYRNEDAIPVLKNFLLEVSQGLNNIYQAYNSVDAVVAPITSIDQIMKLCLNNEKNLNNLIKALVIDALVIDDTAVSVAGVALDAEKIRSLVKVPDVSNLCAAIRHYWKITAHRSHYIDPRCFKIEDNSVVVDEVEQARLIERNLAIYATTPAQKAIHQALLKIRDAVNGDLMPIIPEDKKDGIAFDFSSLNDLFIRDSTSIEIDWKKFKQFHLR